MYILAEMLIGMIAYGFLTVIIGHITGHVFKQLKETEIPKECADWNKNHIMEFSLFIIGAITWLLSYGLAKYTTR